MSLPRSHRPKQSRKIHRRTGSSSVKATPLRLEVLEDRIVPSLMTPTDLVAVGSELFFAASDGVHGRELWKSNGTAAGTLMVKDIDPGPSGSYPAHLTNVSGTLFFAANDGTHGTELWRSNGTAAGTLMVKDIHPGKEGYLNGSYPAQLDKRQRDPFLRR